VVGLASGLIGGVTLYFVCRSEAAASDQQAASGRRARRRLAVTPVIGPGFGGASLRLAW